jgi:glutamate N-acetyltransferase / amino-acid N-acetyltransferase
VTALPAGFACHVDNIGIKDDTDDFVVIAADRQCPPTASSPGVVSPDRACS